jgi:predicted nuclease with TOPRIM domain
MSEFALNSEVAQGAQSDSALETGHEPHSDSGPHESAAGLGALTLSANDFAALEDRILRAVEVVRRERQARTAAEERAGRAEAQLRDLSPQLEQLEKELSALRAERDQVRGRVERLLGQLDALEL